jgi:hypothetical protein
MALLDDEKYVRSEKCADGTYRFFWEAPWPARRGNFHTPFRVLSDDITEASREARKLNKALDRWRRGSPWH